MRKQPLKTISAAVSAEIINCAIKRNVNRCMVAQAIQLKYPTATHIFVDSSVIRLTIDKRRYYCFVPQSVKNFIASWDTEKQVKPFKFTAHVGRSVLSGFKATHPNGDNRTNPNKRYFPHLKVRKYAPRHRVNGVCLTVPIYAN